MGCCLISMGKAASRRRSSSAAQCWWEWERSLAPKNEKPSSVPLVAKEFNNSSTYSYAQIILVISKVYRLSSSSYWSYLANYSLENSNLTNVTIITSRLLMETECLYIFYCGSPPPPVLFWIYRWLNTFLITLTVSWTSSSRWASETKAASNWDGGQYILSDNSCWKNLPKSVVSARQADL